jgi:Ca2+/H+ antiporter
MRRHFLIIKFVIVYYHTNVYDRFEFHDRHTQTLKFVVLLSEHFYFLWTAIYISSILTMQDGSSNYLKGLMLILCYLIVAASFFVHIDPSSIGE